MGTYRRGSCARVGEEMEEGHRSGLESGCNAHQIFSPVHALDFVMHALGDLQAIQKITYMYASLRISIRKNNASKATLKLHIQYGHALAQFHIPMRSYFKS